MRDRIVTSISERREAVLSVIRRARRTIALSCFRCSDSAVFAELARASARGVTIEALVTSRVKGKKKKLRKLLASLEQAGAAVRAYSDPLVKYHAKYLIADDGPAIVASLNFTRKCFERTCDALVVTHDPAVVGGLRALMTADYDLKPLPVDVSPRLIVGPERARRQFTELVVGARSSIRLIDPKLSDPELMKLLDARRATGLRVDVFRSKRLGDLRSHGKIMLIDDRIAVVGSIALAPLGLDFRREVAIIVDQRPAVAQIKRLFLMIADSSARRHINVVPEPCLVPL
jgi:cardiolipin synthase